MKPPESKAHSTSLALRSLGDSTLGKFHQPGFVIVRRIYAVLSPTPCLTSLAAHQLNETCQALARCYGEWATDGSAPLASGYCVAK